jgi:hypothetical protein
LAVVEASCAVFCWDMLRGSGSTTERRKRGRRVFEGIEKGKENIRGGTRVAEEIVRRDRRRGEDSTEKK